MANKKLRIVYEPLFLFFSIPLLVSISLLESISLSIHLLVSISLLESISLSIYPGIPLYLLVSSLSFSVCLSVCLSLSLSVFQKAKTNRNTLLSNHDHHTIQTRASQSHHNCKATCTGFTKPQLIIIK